MKLMSVLSAICFATVLFFTACNANKNEDTDMDSVGNDLEEMGDEVEQETEEAFEKTKAEFSKETAALKAEAEEIKKEVKENFSEPLDERVDRYLTQLDQGLNDLEVKSREFAQATDQRKDQIKMEFEKLENQVEKAIENIKDEFDNEG
ncbi:hypothetical protein SAMN04488057_11944 [Cyclobacterium lianum]|uniref:Uncharacterized protein n=1 Tax=Cyclobacterium lianum TaxID=388280 RepID=A0A1M7QJW2_9BACT|nr:hypothetical protein [Cyclobacterium lianum]SHN31559.1 hypothetical protein SAMN04488057_11944 [Cyclobacterium lianum]